MQHSFAFQKKFKKLDFISVNTQNWIKELSYRFQTLQDDSYNNYVQFRKRCNYSSDFWKGEKGIIL